METAAWVQVEEEESQKGEEGYFWYQHLIDLFKHIHYSYQKIM